MMFVVVDQYSIENVSAMKSMPRIAYLRLSEHGPLSHDICSVISSLIEKGIEVRVEETGGMDVTVQMHQFVRHLLYSTGCTSVQNIEYDVSVLRILNISEYLNS